MNFINWDKGDYCNKCHTNSLKLITNKGTKINVNASHNNMQIDCMRCDNCGNEFMINWTGKLPRPLNGNIKLNLFLNAFKK